MNKKQVFVVVFLVVSIVLSLTSVAIIVAVENVKSEDFGVSYGEIKLVIEPNNNSVQYGSYYGKG